MTMREHITSVATAAGEAVNAWSTCNLGVGEKVVVERLRAVLRELGIHVSTPIMHCMDGDRTTYALTELGDGADVYVTLIPAGRASVISGVLVITQDTVQMLHETQLELFPAGRERGVAP